MAFNGGGTSPVTAHVHTNAGGQGGSLDGTTLINDGGLFALMVALG